MKKRITHNLMWAGPIFWIIMFGFFTESCGPAATAPTESPTLTLATTSFEGVWSNKPRRPSATMTIDADHNYTFTLDDEFYYMLVCKDTLLAILPNYSTTGKISDDGGFIGFWEDTTRVIKQYMYFHGTVTDTMISMRVIVSSPVPCNAKRNDGLWLTRQP